ncbi:MAG TPA: TraM recognition domain-containing protein [Streptosporangiaceae bacterium]
MTTRKVSGTGKDEHHTSVILAGALGLAFSVFVFARWAMQADWLTLAALAATLATLLFAAWAVWPRRKLPRHRVRYMRIRARMRLYPGPGHATAFELWQRWGSLAAAHRARRSRRSLTWTDRMFRPSQTSVLLGRAHYARPLRIPVEEHVLWMSLPRTGKTAALADIIASYPGPVVATTTRGDLHELTAAARSRKGPVYVWNPQQLADIPSNMHWDVLAGCEDPATAIRRAQPLSSISEFKGEGEDFWSAATAMWLQTLMHVAALRHGTMDLVHYWALQKSPEDFLRALPGAGGESERWGALVMDQMTSKASRTTDTIRYMLASSLGFMVDPQLRKAVIPGADTFSPEEFVRRGGTLYLVAESRDNRPSPVAGVFAALVTEIYHQAASAAGRLPGGRLDPPMLWALDEVTQTCPLPLPSLLADAGGRGIQIMPVVHGIAQLRERWGKDGARIILDTCGTKMFLPGISDPETLEMASKLSGDMAQRERGHEHYSRHPVMTEDMIRRLPASKDGTGHAFVLRGNLSPVIAKPPVVWHGRHRKALKRMLSGLVSDRNVLTGEVVAPPALEPDVQPDESSLENLGWPGPLPWDDPEREPVVFNAPVPDDADVRPQPEARQHFRTPRPWDQLSDSKADATDDSQEGQQ